jgi:hypothetical protein
MCRRSALSRHLGSGRWILLYQLLYMEITTGQEVQIYVVGRLTLIRPSCRWISCSTCIHTRYSRLAPPITPGPLADPSLAPPALPAPP